MRVSPIALVFSSLLLVACGQKGPLYLPQDRSVDKSSVNNNVDNGSFDKSDDSADKPVAESRDKAGSEPLTDPVSTR